MDELTRRALARLPMTTGDVKIMYAIGTPPMKALCESHERLRAELEGTAALLRDAEAEILRLRDAINRLTLAAGGTLVTDGDTTCTLGWWAARVLEGKNDD